MNATLEELDERLSTGEAADLALYLPDPLESTIREPSDESTTDYSFDEFVQRASCLEDFDEEEVTVHVRAVGSTLAETASERKIDAAKSNSLIRPGCSSNPRITRILRKIF